ncbi:hypothetical protein E8E11_008010 [Didymella keratinophila]|nr:hypothetical protein E8E11_008010 [Didymella keratinophila]
MPLLDALRLSFDPSVTIEDRASVFGKEWQVAREYVLHQPGLETMYTSHLSEKHDFWVFLVWMTDGDRSHFYHQSTGFGLLSCRMKKVPSVFFLGDDDYARLEASRRWAVHVILAERRDGQAHVRLIEEQEKQFFEHPGQCQFAARQERGEYEKLYKGNDFDYALVGISHIGYDHPAPGLTAALEFEAEKVELTRFRSLLYPTPSPSKINTPVDIADLTRKQPWEYGVLSHDGGKYMNSAYPMSLSFRPMSTLHMANKFLPASSQRNSVVTEAREQYTVCIISASSNVEVTSTFEDLRKRLGLLDGRDGLRELRVLRGITPSAGSDSIRIVCTWNTPADLTRWWQAAGSSAVAKIQCSWTVEKLGWEDLKWDTMPATPDKQGWQKVDKILEIVDFKFERDLTNDEKTAPKLAKAGKDGLSTLIAALEYQSKVPGAKKPTVSKGELDTIIATYRVLFGDIKAKNDDGTPNPNFPAEAAEHIAAIKVTRDSLNRMTKPGNLDLIIHCNDDWLSERGPKSAAPKPSEPLKSGSKYFYDMDRNRWISVKGGKPCQGNKAAVTTMNSKISGTTREKGPERVTFCKDYLKRQHQLEKDKQPHLWDISKAKLPDTFTTYNQAGKKDQTLPFHISAFGKKIGAKWFHEFMHTELFHPSLNTFSDKKVPDSEGGTGGVAYGFEGAVGLARQKGGKNVAVSSRNIENILYWSLAMYYDKWVWSTGKPEERSSLITPPVQARNVEEEFQVDVAAKKPPKKTDKTDDPPKTEESKEPPKTEAPPPPPKTEAPPPPPPKTEAPVEPPKTSAAPPPPPPPPPPTPSSQAPSPPASLSAALPVSSPAPPASSVAPPASAPETTPPANTQLPTSKASSMISVSTLISISSALSGLTSASASLPSSCSNTLCTLPSSSITPTSSGAVPEETFESEPMSAGSMTGSEILTMAESIASEQIVAMGLWDQVLAEMGLPAESPSETVEADPTASAGTGLPMATGGMGDAANERV